MLSSKSSLIFCLLFLSLAGSWFYPRWQQAEGEAQLSWDAAGYYWYLPSIFIYDDLRGQSFKDEVLQKYKMTPPEDFQYGYRHESSGHYVLRYTPGLALLEAPFFFIGHAAAHIFGYPPDGFSPPYQLAIYLGGLLVAFIGLFYLRRLLLHYFSDTTVAIVLLILVLGTNYLNYAGIDVGMSHSWLFTLYVLLILQTHHFYQTFQRRHLLGMGVLVGLLALVRPPEVIAIIIPALWGIDSISAPAILGRLRLFWAHRWALILAASICAIFLAVPFIYWKWSTGHWFVYTYREQGFDWLHPMLWHYPMNPQTGWLMHTPIMFLLIPATAFFLFKGKNRLAILLFSAVYFYIVCAWRAWDYGGRAMIQSYPILLFILATAIEWLRRQRNIAHWIATPLIALFAYYNLWWTYQAHGGQGLSFGAPSTYAYYFRTALRYDVPREVQKLRDHGYLFEGSISNPHFNLTDTDTQLLVTGAQPQTLRWAVNPDGQDWIRVEADFYTDRLEGDLWNGPVLGVKLWHRDTPIYYGMIRAIRFLENGHKKRLSIDLPISDKVFDAVEFEFRNENQGNTQFTIDNLQLRGFSE